MRFIWLFLLLACPSPEPHDPVVTESSEGGELDSSELGPALDDAWMLDALERGLHEVAADSLAWAEHFSEVAEGDEADPRTDDEGMVRDAVRYCGSDVEPALRRLTTTLRNKIGMLGDDAFACAGGACTFAPVGEYDLDATLELRRTGNSFEIVAVTRIDSAASTEDYLRRARDWLQGALRALDPCPAET